MLKRRMEHPQFQSEKYKSVILAFQEARTRQEAGDAIVGLLVQGQNVSDPSRKEAESQYMSTLAHYLLIAQGLEDPDVLTYEQIEVDFREQQYPPQYQQQPVQMGGGMFGRGGGGFWDTLIKSAEIGAGFEIGTDIVNDIFGGF
ncbi:hypothetical protein [Alicyclobacillus mengziensis]|uniref:Uncharacterized protein n=1 Tax=Alicyclobacillus mengziensis TaxID=2931921 RepID=A0A9X7Z8X5_9BACL|nr:hypothetical protein [Alicyclobacillus mengziensis]QSO48873.1 hypothetical protein JZ786_07965 [Alicyclobacillus mengziensis]